MDIIKNNLTKEIANLSELWKIKNINQINDHIIKIVKINGDFIMHAHNNGEKLFYVIEGVLFIEFENNDILEVKPKEYIIMPEGVLHKPFAKEETILLFIEKV